MRKIIISIFIIGALLLPITFSANRIAVRIGETATQPSLYIDTEVIWTAEDSPYVIGSYPNASLYIAPGGSLFIEPGVAVMMYDGASIRVDGELFLNGGPDNPVIITSHWDDADEGAGPDGREPAPGDWQGIYVEDDGYLSLENTAIRYGGYQTYLYDRATDGYWIGNRARAQEDNGRAVGAINMVGEGNIEIEDSVITGNTIGLWIAAAAVGEEDKEITISGSEIWGNTAAGIINDTEYVINAEENWWGDNSGPYHETGNPAGLGERLVGPVDFDNWLTRENGGDEESGPYPVIIVPGIGASVNLDLMIGGIFNDNWKMFDHTYDGIIEAFKAMGYEEDIDLYICYYDWRQDNAVSAAEFLKPLIDRALAASGSSKVNIVAHSMGGLVARSYIQGDNYGNDVDNLFLIGTPNHGSSDIYPVWEGGYVPKNWDHRVIMNAYINLLKVKGWSKSSYETVHHYIPSVKQLLPVYSYIHPVNDPENILNYVDMTVLNNFLLDLNSDIPTLNDRAKVSVISGNGQDTVNMVPVIEASEEAPLWMDGKPVPLDPAKNDTAGDGRVLLSSSEIQSYFAQTLSGSHGAIVSLAEPLIATELNKYLDIMYPAPVINSEMLVWVASPVDIEINDPVGKTISSSINDIPLARYTSESKPDGVKLISIPNPVAGKYEIHLTGNGAGEYHLGLEYADYTGSKEDYSALVQGEVAPGETREYAVAYDPQAESPVGGIESGGITIDSTIADIDRLYETGEISKEAARDNLVKSLEWIKRYEEKYGERLELRDKVADQIMDKCSDKRSDKWCAGHIGKKIGQVIYILDGLHAMIVKVKYNLLLAQLKSYYRKNWVSAPAYGIIKEDIEYLIDNL